MEIKRGNTVVSDVYLKDNSYVTEEIMGEHTLSLNFLSRRVIELQIGDYVEFEGETYRIRHNEKITKRETSLGWEYNVTFYASRYDLGDVEFFLHGAPERKKNFDYFTGTATEWLALLVKNMNRVTPGWAAGSCIESRAITLSFKDKKVGSVLDEIVKELDTEYWISGKTINIGRREYASEGLVLGQGPGMGFAELEVSAVDDAPPVTVLYPYGSDRNLGRDYGNDYLVLPGGRKSIEENVDKYGRIEQSKQFEHIFPKGEFTVTEKIDTCTLRASGIDFNLKDCLLDGVDVIVTFQDGGLAGYDLAIIKESVDDTTKQFKLKENAEENALTVPGDINFSIGDRFILTGIKMPQSYIDKAEQQLLKEATAWLSEHSEKRIQLRGKCDEVVFRLQNLFIACGQMVGVYSEELKIDREIRVTKVKRYIENDGKPCYRYELTLSDFLQTNGFKDMVDDVQKMPEEIEGKVKPVREWTKRSWRDVMETLGMMFDPEGDYFTEFIKPLAVHTAQLIVGTNSQQMDLIGVRFIPNADNDPNYFKSTAGRLVHFTVREDGVAEWQIPASAHRLNNAVAYYVYAKCSKTSSAGSILLSERQIKLEEEAGYYHFWIGVLNTPEENVRSWNPNYGYTEIAGQTITTGVIKDKNGNLVIDLNQGTLTGYGNITDSPDLSVYAYQSELKIQADKISATVTKVDTLTNRVDKAGWITRAEGNQWWASSDLEDGNRIVSYINQTSTSVTINANRINLQGAVSFSMFNNSLKSLVDNKLETEDMGNMAFKDTVSSNDLSQALKDQINSIADKVDYGSLNAYTQKGQITKADLVQALQNELTGKLTGSATLSSDAKKIASIIVNGKSLIAGGYIQADYLNVNTINAVVGEISGFKFQGNQISADEPWGSFVRINSTGGLYTKMDEDHVANFGPMATSVGSGYNAKAYIRNAVSSEFCNDGILLELNAADECRYLICSFSESASYREAKLSVKHFKNDASWAYRTCLKMSHMPHWSNIDTVTSNRVERQVMWDETTGMLYYK